MCQPYIESATALSDMIDQTVCTFIADFHVTICNVFAVLLFTKKII